MNGHAIADQSAHCRLHVQGISSQSIDSVDMQRIERSYLLQQLREARTVAGHDGAADAAVVELLVEGAAERLALGFNGLVSRANAIIG
jgi:hypothetical protein